jgi:hypothetical protein
MAEYKKFQKKYGNEEIAVIAFEDSDIFTPENISLIREISLTAKKSSGIQRVFSLTEAKEAVGDNDSVSIKKIIPENITDQEQMSRLKKRILGDHLLVNNIISHDGKTAMVVMELEPFDDNKEKSRLILDIRDKAIVSAKGRVKLRFSGAPYIEVELNRLSLKDSMTFTPAVVFMIFVIVSLFLRRKSLAALAMVMLGLTVVWAVGLYTMSGQTMNMVTVVIPPVLLAIAVGDAVHILAHFREIRSEKNITYREAVTRTMRMVWLPCFFTSITTAAGFISFATSTIDPVRMVGIFTCAGVMIAYFLTIIFLPAALILFQQWFDFVPPSGQVTANQVSDHSYFSRVIAGIGNFTITRHRPILAAGVLIIAVALFGISRLRFETNFGNYLPAGSQLRDDADFITERMGGIIPIEFLIRANTPDLDFNTPGSLRLLSEIQKELPEAVPIFTSSYSFADYVKDVNRAFNEGREEFYSIPDDRRDISFYASIGDSEIIDRVLSVNRMEARISMRSIWTSNEHAEASMVQIKKYFDRKLHGNYTFIRTGLAPLYVKMGDNLKRSQLTSFITAFIIITIMMYFVCRNLTLTAITIIPNVFPILIMWGIMGLLNIPLDVSTIMIASVTMGIAVDDTTHFLTWFRRAASTGMNVTESLMSAYMKSGRPMVITSLVLFAGFFVLILGAIKPTKSFGVLTAISMLIALVGDLFILQALIMFTHYKQKENEQIDETLSPEESLLSL